MKTIRLLVLVCACVGIALTIPTPVLAQYTNPSNPSYGTNKPGQCYNTTLNNWVGIANTSANLNAYPIQCDQYGNLTVPSGTFLPLTGGTVTGPTTFSGGLINTTKPVRDTSRQLLIAAMTAVDTAGVNIGSSGTGNAAFSWAVTSANWYDMQCKLPVTFVASATISFQLVSISGSVTASLVNGESAGNTAASAAFQDLFATGAAITTPTTTTGAPGGVSEMVTVGFQFLTSHAGNIGIEFIGNGANNVQLLAGGECGVTQIN